MEPSSLCHDFVARLAPSAQSPWRVVSDDLGACIFPVQGRSIVSRIGGLRRKGVPELPHFVHLGLNAFAELDEYRVDGRDVVAQFCVPVLRAMGMHADVVADGAFVDGGYLEWSVIRVTWS